MTKVQWHNPKTNQLQSMPPWGNNWVADCIKEEYYAAGWRQVAADFKLPEQEPTPEEQQATLQKTLTDAVQAHMDKTAQNNGYDNILSAVTYAEESAVPKFQAEGQAYRAWRSAVWAYCYAQLAAILSGERDDVPTPEQLITELPALVLPE